MSFPRELCTCRGCSKGGSMETIHYLCMTNNANCYFILWTIFKMVQMDILELSTLIVQYDTMLVFYTICKIHGIDNI